MRPRSPLERSRLECCRQAIQRAAFSISKQNRSRPTSCTSTACVRPVRARRLCTLSFRSRSSPNNSLMHSLPRRLRAVLVALIAVPGLGLPQSAEKIRNDKVLVYEDNIQGGEAVSRSSETPALILYLGQGTLEMISRRGTPTTVETKPGNVKFEPRGIQVVSNRGSSPVRMLRVDFKGQGSPERWGRTGLSSHYKVLLEN